MRYLGLKIACVIMAGVYIHIPFCKQLCYYCDFYRCISLAKKGELLSALETEMALQAGFLGDVPLKTIYIGGGTPTVYAPEELQRLIDRARNLWDCSSVEEITVEANPDDLTPVYVEALARTEINRLSIGIQSFIDRDLQWMHRRHMAQAAIDAVRRVQAAGFGNVTIDLIYGIPGMTDREWRMNLEQALELGVQHISAYHLTIEPNTVFGRRQEQGGLSPVDEETSQRQYEILHETLTKGGFEHYEISNFALPGFRAVHNSSYWNGEPYLGIGPSAHSYDRKRRRWVVASLEDYLAGVDSGTVYEEEILSPVNQYNEYVMTRLRCADGINLKEMESRFGARELRRFLADAEKFIREGILICCEGYCKIPARNFLVSDNIICDLFVDDDASESSFL